MRVVNQITFEAKDDAEALRLASERLGKDAVILSTRTVRVGGFLGFFQRSVLMVSAGILQEDEKEEKGKEREKDDAAKERLVAFQKLLEFKQAAEMRTGAMEVASPVAQPAASDGTAKVIYSPAGFGAASSRNVQPLDSVHLSSAGLASVEQREAFSSPQSSPADADALKLREEVGDLSKRLDMILQRLDRAPGELPPEPEGEKIFESGLPGISSGDSARDVDMDDLYKKLVMAEVEPDCARRLVKEYRTGAVKEPFEKWLESKVPCAAELSSEVVGGRKVMLLGPTGVGKTTTIAKLAAIQALWEHKNVLLLTSDTYRIAAVDQLRTYAKILGVPIEVVFEVENFDGILEDHADAELILLDTAGRGQRDRKNLEAFEVIYNVFKPDAVHLVLAANMKYRDMLDVVERMSVVPITHVIFTKLDETVSYGALFSILQSLERPVSFFTTGQNVPNDIEMASGERLVALLMGDEVKRGMS